MTLATLLNEYGTQYGSLSALAEAIGVSPSRLSRLAAGKGSMEPLTCLRLAQVTGANPSSVLRAAGKGELAAMIEDVYRRTGRTIAMPALSPEQREVMARWAQFREPAQRAAALAIWDYLVQLVTGMNADDAVIQRSTAEVLRLETEAPRLETERQVLVDALEQHRGAARKRALAARDQQQQPRRRRAGRR